MTRFAARRAPARPPAPRHAARRGLRPLLLGACAAGLLAAAAGLGWFAMAPRPAQTAQDTLPLPPDPPRLSDGPEAERCFALVGADPRAARAYALQWEVAGGADAARHCAALATLALGEPARAAERLEAIARDAQAGAAARAAVFAQAAQAWLLAGDANRAYGASTLALALAPDDPDLLTDRAVVLGSLGRFREAVEDLDRALAADPDRAEALVFRAAAWRRLDRPEAARRDVEAAIRASPSYAEAWLERGILRQLAGDVAGARQDWLRVIALAPNTATADLAEQNLALNEAGPARR